MALAGALAAYWIGRGQPRRSGKRSSEISNPSSLYAALSFALLYALIRLGVRAAEHYYGSAGMYAASAIAALADVDAVTIALASAGPSADGWRGPAAAASVALVVNTLFKLGLAVSLGAGAFRPRVAGALGAMAIAGTATAAVVYLWDWPG
jgi:uncharacterized membrane protein (DUF4010 family)